MDLHRPRGEGMDFLPNPPTHFVKTCGPTVICPVHIRRHGWYECLPKEEDWEQLMFDIGVFLKDKANGG